MNINVSIVDQRITGIIEDHPELLPDGDENKKKSSAFVLLCMSTALELNLEEAAELLTEGGNDAGVDGIHISEVDDGEFAVTIFQGKYKVKDLKGIANFPENGVQKAVNTVATLFDPAKKIELNNKIAPKVEEIRSLVRDGYIPSARVVLCNNGTKWNEQAQNWITQSGFTENQVTWIHYNHDSIVSVLQRKKAVDDSIRLEGKAVIEDFNFRRVLVGKVAVTEIAELFNRHDDLLLERNIRRYLGLHSNRVNAAIHETLVNEQKRDNFYFFNNGITMICRKFRHNALQGENYQLKLEGMQIINGGQTCKTIQQTLYPSQKQFFDESFENVYVLLRIYELSEDDQDFVRDITYATNSQNPVDLRDLRSNDEIQRQLEIGIKDLGYIYKRKREEGGRGSSVITSSIVAESVLAIWRKKPQQAKFRRKEHFGKLYDAIFKELNAAQALLATLIFRHVENERKRPSTDNPPDFLPYASHYISMLVGRKLLADKNLQISDVSHRNFNDMHDTFEKQKTEYHRNSIDDITKALKQCYGDRHISLQQLSATFRRGDLIEMLAERGTIS
ncbi:MAG: AIPR family protein [Thermodesulfobacteriota bacterium]|nr:AIPR family protein [Thermodesulfobacteriota bacterium]